VLLLADEPTPSAENPNQPTKANQGDCSSTVPSAQQLPLVPLQQYPPQSYFVPGAQLLSGTMLFMVRQDILIVIGVLIAAWFIKVRLATKS
jgi:hypothetical protein